jgi:hypothetical protein
MTDISHGYEDLGLLLKDKIGELSTKLSRLQKAQEESSAMMQWLQTMSNTATKWHQAPTPVDTEAVKSQVEQNKVSSTGPSTGDTREPSGPRMRPRAHEPVLVSRSVTASRSWASLVGCAFL